MHDKKNGAHIESNEPLFFVERDLPAIPAGRFFGCK